MLTLMFPAIDDQEAVELQFEHSLVSLSKWESLHEKPFYDKNEKTEEEMRSYVTQMLQSNTAPELWLDRMTTEHLIAIQKYINRKQTATTFRDDPNAPKSREIITAEIIYYWLIAFNIPFQPTEDWHLNRLMTLVQVCSIKQAKPKKMTKQQQMAEYRRLNDERRRDLRTSG